MKKDSNDCETKKQISRVQIIHILTFLSNGRAAGQKNIHLFFPEKMYLFLAMARSILNLVTFHKQVHTR